jgi:hypothetical protein
MATDRFKTSVAAGSRIPWPRRKVLLRWYGSAMRLLIAGHSIAGWRHHFNVPEKHCSGRELLTTAIAPGERIRSRDYPRARAIAEIRLVFGYRLEERRVHLTSFKVGLIRQMPV